MSDEKRMQFERFDFSFDKKYFVLLPTVVINIDELMYGSHNIAIQIHLWVWHFRWLWMERE